MPSNLSVSQPTLKCVLPEKGSTNAMPPPIRPKKKKKEKKSLKPKSKRRMQNGERSAIGPWLPNQIARKKYWIQAGDTKKEPKGKTARNEATFFTLKWQIVKITEAATARKIEQRHRHCSQNDVRQNGRGGFPARKDGAGVGKGKGGPSHREADARPDRPTGASQD